jgi:hypothetical protein
MNNELQRIEGQDAPLPARIEDITPPSFLVEPYGGAMQIPLSREESAALGADFPPEDISVKPTESGELYIGHALLRQRLNSALGLGTWTMRPAGELQAKGYKCMQLFRLYVRGAFAGEAYGEAQRIENNDDMSEGEVYEALKGNGLMRCCKELGVGLQVWNPRHNSAFLRDHCVKVFVNKKAGGKGVAWRRKDAQPFWNETGIAKDQEPKEPAPPIQQAQRKSEARAAAPATAQPDLAADAAEIERLEKEAYEREQAGLFSAEGGDAYPASEGWRRITPLAVGVQDGKSKRYWVKFQNPKDGTETYASTFKTDIGEQVLSLRGVHRPVPVRMTTSGKGFINVEEVGSIL